MGTNTAPNNGGTFTSKFSVDNTGAVLASGKISSANFVVQASGTLTGGGNDQNFSFQTRNFTGSSIPALKMNTGTMTNSSGVFARNFN